MAERRYVYMNYAQQEFYQCSSRNMVGVFARRTGKTHGMLAPYMHRVQKSMPCGHGAFLGLSRKQIMARTMPAVTMSFGSIWSLREGEHFVFGKPPAKLNYPAPVYKPRDWSNTISFANGFYWSLVSLSVMGSANGETFSNLVGDEAKFWPREKLVNEVLPANSGVIHPYGDPSHTRANPYYQGSCFVSDATLSSRGSWLEREEAKMDIPIESGPNKGRTSRELQKELLEHAHIIMDINDAVYFAKKAGRKVIAVSPEKRDRAKELKRLCAERKGKFHLPGMNGENTEANCKMLVQKGVLTEADAELLFCADFLITEQQWLYYRMFETQPKFQEHITQLRRDCFNYFQGSTIENLALLGKEYIEVLKRDLPPLVFAISVLGIKMKQSGDGFYYALDIDNVHGYIDVEDASVIDDSFTVKTVSRRYNGKDYSAEVETPDFERLAEIDDCRLDGDLHDEDEIFISFDYNSRINWCCVFVKRLDLTNMTETVYLINSMFVKGEEKIESLMKKFNHYYAPHRRRNNKITYIYDHTAVRNEGYALETVEDFKDTVQKYLRQAGWDYTALYIGKAMAHDVKYREINNGLDGTSFPAIRINKQKNEALIVALENAGVKQDYNGFSKDKSGEKLAYNPDLESSLSTSESGRIVIDSKRSNIPEEYRTDGTDAFDTGYIGIKHFLGGASEVIDVY